MASLKDVSVSCYLRRGAATVNASRLDLGPVTVWFSYSTPVAFRVAGGPLVMRENEWGPTTGRHMNMIGDGDTPRVTGEEFARLFAERVGRFFEPRDLTPECPPNVVADWLRDRGLHAAADAVTATATAGPA